jgi:glycosyltransferase involved in cell wall biosynthesis
VKPSVSPPIRRTSTLVVSSYPPRHCGIGLYARVQVESLREHGEDVTVISPPDGDGDVRVPFLLGRPFLRAARIGGSFDRILVHFQPALYYRLGVRAPVSRVCTSLALWWLTVRRPQTEILVHEAGPPVPWRPDTEVLRWAFRRARLLFHTEAERRQLERTYRISTNATLVPHVDGVRVGSIARAEARTRLGVAEGTPLFVCAGFVHPDKGFERAIATWKRAGRPGRLVIVGSVRDRTPPNLAYEAMLRREATGEEGLTFLDGFVSSEDFDAWIAAADLLVLPYRRSWSSGALARAQLLGTPAAVAAVGGLPEQAGPRDVVFRSDDELTELFVPRIEARA